jgi:hypothetical protein
MDSEKVYINGGEIYKDNEIKTLGAKYSFNPEGDGLFPFTKDVSETYPQGKKYIFTREFKDYFPMDVNNEGIDISSYDLCPSVNLWIALGAPAEGETKNYDLFFAVQSVEELKAAAVYYKLPYPITSEIEDLITNAPNTIHFWKADDIWVVPAGVQYRNGVATLLKLYTYPTDVPGWKTWMLGSSYVNNGTVHESGGIYHQLTGGHGKEGYILRGKGSHQKAESIVSSVDGESSTNYTFTKRDEGGDPVIMWQGEVTDSKTGNKKIKHYKSTKMFREVMCNLTSGDNLETYDLCPDVNFWLGRSFYDDGSEDELYFVAENSAQLDKVAGYYSLSVPYNDSLKAKLDNEPELLRVRYYDMLKLGEGNFIPIVAASVVIKENAAVKIKLYEFTREV